MLLTKFLSGMKSALIGSSEDSKSVARSRLQFVLVQDRAGMSSDEMTHFKQELIGVIEKYFKIEANKFDITYRREGETTTLLINSPVVVKRGASGAALPNGSQKNKGNAQKDNNQKDSRSNKDRPGAQVAANEV